MDHNKTDFSKVKGFEKLTLKQQELLMRVNERHKLCVGTDYKDGWTPVNVKLSGNKLQVQFKNGDWLYYYENETWG